MTISDALQILGIGTGEIRRAAWEKEVWLKFQDSKIVNPELLTADDLRAEDWHWSPICG